MTPAFFLEYHPAQMGDLSEHFSKSEFACPDCGRGRPSPALLAILEAARSLLGSTISITSGYRCAAHNAEIGGKEPSEHGNYSTEVTDAADIYCDNSRPRFYLVKTFLELGVRRLGIGDYHLHIGVGAGFPQDVIFPDKERQG